jgi:hypothetical protein
MPDQVRHGGTISGQLITGLRAEVYLRRSFLSPHRRVLDFIQHPSSSIEYLFAITEY